MKLRQNVNWLIEQYQRNVEVLEQDVKDDKSTFNNFRQTKLGVYKAVIEDLQKVLEVDE